MAIQPTESDPPFDPIARETVSSQIRGQLLHRISTGELAPGSVMPSERDLSQRFQVARTSVREAMQGLVSIGAVERRGNRSYVVEHLPEVVLERRDDRKSFVSELFETRRVLEVPLFVLAAERADDDQREQVGELARKFDPDLEIAVFRRLDRDFHTTVAASCANPVLIELYGKVLDLLFRSGEFDTLLSAATNRPGVERIIADSAIRHRAIADAFVAGDLEAVRIATEAHLSSVEQSMVEDLA
jgi:GntR family transcriptional regulator, transcriptional repressor for pyruvate dehydrogenase complex